MKIIIYKYKVTNRKSLYNQRIMMSLFAN